MLTSVEELFEEVLPALLVVPAAVVVFAVPVRLVVVGGRWLAVEGALRLDEALELASIEEQPTTLRALVDVYTVALVAAHLSLALGTGHRRAAYRPAAMVLQR